MVVSKALVGSLGGTQCLGRGVVMVVIDGAQMKIAFTVQKHLFE